MVIIVTVLTGFSHQAMFARALILFREKVFVLHMRRALCARPMRLLIIYWRDLYIVNLLDSRVSAWHTVCGATEAEGEKKRAHLHLAWSRRKGSLSVLVDETCARAE